MINNIINIFIAGFGILAVAMLINFLANLLGLETWYSFIEYIQKNGLMFSIKTKWTHLFFLLFFYPFILGASAYYLLKLLN